MSMKTKYFVSTAMLALCLSACTNYFDEHMLGNKDPKVADVRTGMTYILTEDDYKQVTNYADNISKTLALDPVDSTGLT